MTVNIIVQLLFRCFNYLLALVLDTIQLLTIKVSDIEQNVKLKHILDLDKKIIAIRKLFVV